MRFSDTLTVFSEDYPEAQLYVIRTAELTFAEVCSMYEPPPEYRDLPPPFDPPDGYRDDAYLLPFLKEARAAAAAARAAANAAANVNSQVGPQGHQSPGAPTGDQLKVVERPSPPPPPPPAPAHPPLPVVSVKLDVKEAPRIPPPPTEKGKSTQVTNTGSPSRKLDVVTCEDKEFNGVKNTNQEDVKTLVVVLPEPETENQVGVVEENDESSPVILEDDDEAILMELKKQLECNNGGDIEADLAELLPPGLVLAEVAKDLEDVKIQIDRNERDLAGEVLRDTTPLVTLTSASTTPVTTPDEKQEDSDSSADSQDTIILMTNEEEKKAEEAEVTQRGVFRQKLLIIGDKSPSDTSSVSSSTSQDSDGSLRSTESTTSSTTNSEDRTESPTGSSGSSGRPGNAPEDDVDDDDDDYMDLDAGLSCSNSQVRKTIERTAMRRSLTRVTDVRKRPVSLQAKSPTSSNDVSLVEKLRWLTSLDDDDADCPTPPHDHQRRASQEAFLQDAGRPLPPSAYPRGFQQRPASFSQGGDSCRPSLTMIPVAPRDYRMVRRVPGENHPQQNKPPARPPTGGKETPPDELERFVQQDMERTERIRKRYSLSEDDAEDPSFGFARRPSVRGIRSRFGGSTNEILKEVQLLHHPGMNMPGSHLSWSHPVELPPPNHKTPQQVKVMLLPRVSEEDPSSSRNYGSAGDIAALTRARGTRVFHNQQAPAQVVPPVAKDERGVPEGACSSPKVPVDPVYRVQQKTATLPVVTEAPQGVVYYSLNV